ncbi:MAG: cobalt transporter CbiM [Cyanobacteriota bacterium]|nr:cobalt transporter CbiM [Cyanobacteriota bacterium]
MHVPEGILSSQVCITGYAITSLTTWYSLREINKQPNPQEQIPKASLLTAAFFVASTIHIPIPPASVHLVLNGLLGTVLGYYAFPAILVGLFFQAVMFGHGGMSTLGVNGIIMGVPALLAHQIFVLRHVFRKRLDEKMSSSISAFFAGATAVGLATVIFFLLVITNIPSDWDLATERTAMYGLMLAHLPLMVIEGIFTAMVVSFIQRVKPEILPS